MHSSFARSYEICLHRMLQVHVHSKLLSFQRFAHQIKTTEKNTTENQTNNGSRKEIDRFAQTSSLICQTASVCSDQPHATSIGIDILKKGGNAADATVAMMAAISVVQPHACGIGGDCQCLFFRNKDKSIMAINGSGRTGKNSSLEKLKAAGIKDITALEYKNHGLWVSVPGTVKGMFDIVKHFGSGKLAMEDILSPAIQLAEHGTPVPYKTAMWWHKYYRVIKNSRNVKDLLNEENPLKPGDIIRSPKLANRLKEISKGGPEAFYRGDMAQQMVRAVQGGGGVLTMDDLEDHLVDPPYPNPSEALCVDFEGFRVWEMRPNTTGIVALVALNVLKGYDLKALGHNSPEYIHLLTEAMKLAYLECWEFLCDPKWCPKPPEYLLTEETANKIRSQIDPEKAFNKNVCFSRGDTSYSAVVDGEGNGCSTLCSIASFGGSGIIPDECGFIMHERAKCMSQDEKSSNVFGPRKLPQHSLMPSLVTDASTNELLAVFGMNNRWMQPQGQVQILLNMVVFGMDPQVALNQPRFFLGYVEALADYTSRLQRLCLEGGLDTNVLPYLERKGHTCRYMYGTNRDTFGLAHVIARPKLFNVDSSYSRSETWWSGADPRSDGNTMGF